LSKLIYFVQDIFNKALILKKDFQYNQLSLYTNSI